MSSSPENHLDTRRLIPGPIIVGAGPSGLAAAACLHEHGGVPSLILERSDCIASLWQHKTYDRLKLHIPKRFCELPYLKFPKNFPKYPSKKQFIAYMESYAQHFSIHPRFNRTVESAEYDPASKLWKVKTKEDDNMLFSRWLIVATGENAEPAVPEIPGMDEFHGRVIHTCAYKSGSDFVGQKVLVVGCGNSGMEVCLDLCSHNASPHMVVRNSVHVLPRDIFGVSIFSIWMKLLEWLPLRVVDKLLLLMANFTFGGATEKLGLRRPKTGPLETKKATGKTSVLDVGVLTHIKSGKIKITGGLREITKTGSRFIDGQEHDFDSIILATGYKSNVPSWLKGSDFFTADGMPRSPFPNGWKGENGLYAVGFTGKGLIGTSSDAVNIARDIADGWRSRIDGSMS